MGSGGARVTEPLARPPALRPLESYAARFDESFANLARRRGFRECLRGPLVPRDRDKTLTPSPDSRDRA